jgi:hypothetical protein
VYTMSRGRRALGIAAVLATVTVTFLECTDFVAPYAPMVVDSLDYFEYTVPVDGVTTTSRYFWPTTGTAATVNLMSTVTAGTATMTIADDDSAVIFMHAVDGSGPVGTGIGSAGYWKITVALTNARGTLHFTVLPQ